MVIFPLSSPFLAAHSGTPACPFPSSRRSLATIFTVLITVASFPVATAFLHTLLSHRLLPCSRRRQWRGLGRDGGELTEVRWATGVRGRPRFVVREGVALRSSRLLGLGLSERVRELMRTREIGLL